MTKILSLTPQLKADVTMSQTPEKKKMNQICLEQGDLCNCGEIMNENHYVFIFKKINTSRQKSEEQKLNLHKIYTVQYAILKKYQHLIFEKYQPIIQTEKNVSCEDIGNPYELN